METGAKQTDGEKGEEKEEVECDGGGFGELTHPWRRDLGWLSRGRTGQRSGISPFPFVDRGDERDGPQLHTQS